MAAKKSWVLTDTEEGVWVEAFELTDQEIDFEGASVRKRILHGGLSEGVEIIEIDNGQFSFTVIPTRGMGIWRGRYRGLNVGWQAPVKGPVHPSHVHPQDRGGLGWLTGFDELVVRCGLDSNGAPATDTVPNNMGIPAEVELTLHGRIANIPARRVEVRLSPGDPPTIAVCGIVEEAALFYPAFSLSTTISTTCGSNAFTIADGVTNLKSATAEFELLYHCNFGAPFLDEGARLEVPARLVAPRDARAVEGIDSYAEYLGPTPGFVEQVYWYEPLSAPDGSSLALLRNAGGDRGVAVRFNTGQLPCFSQWKNTAAVGDGFVTGLEPGTDYPNAKPFERQQGRLMRLPPGATHDVRLTVEVHDSPSGVQAVQEEIVAMQSGTCVEVHRTPLPHLSG